jgi:hypothetical protein
MYTSQKPYYTSYCGAPRVPLVAFVDLGFVAFVAFIAFVDLGFAVFVDLALVVGIGGYLLIEP